jgi:dienelactone hydrolase
MFQSARRFALPLALLLVLAACVPIPPETPGAAQVPVATPPRAPQAVEYNLGEATIIQERFPEDSRFRNMPVRLNGVIAVPKDDGPHPVVVVIHGTHPGCPVDETGVDRWPCDPQVEQRNYSGFAYLISALAEQGYLALAPNFNAEHTVGFGEGTPGERLTQAFDLHLQALAEASAGGDNSFGVDLAGRADLSRLALLGHSRGAESAVALANNPEMMASGRSYGPVAGVLLIAGAPGFIDPWTRVHAPLATILAACDGDVVDQSGQIFFEGPRLAPDQSEWAASAWLERASHNAFNSILPPDMVTHSGRSDCTTLLDGEAQRAWLADYARDFLGALFAEDPATVEEAKRRMGLDVTAPAPDKLHGLPARVAFLAPAAGRRAVMVPTNAEELTTNRLGGAVTADKVTTHFCPKGFYTPFTLPGSEPCRRNTVTVPGQPAHAILSWEQPGAALRFALPEDAGDLSGYTSLSLRAAVDPVSPLNPAGRPQAFTVRLTDAAGRSAAGATRAGEPALQFPPGNLQEDEALATGFFTGPVPLTTIRLPLSAFAGVDLTEIRELALVFDRTPTGTLFLSDVEWVRP